MLGIKHLHHCLDGKYFIFLADLSLLKGFFHGKKAGWPVHPEKEIVCMVTDNVDILPPPITGTAEMESLKKDRESPSPAQGRGSLDTTHALCTVNTVLHSETNNYIKCIECFLFKIFSKVMRMWEVHQPGFLQGTLSSCPSPASLACSTCRVDLLWFKNVGHTHPQNKDARGDLSGLHCYLRESKTVAATQKQPLGIVEVDK